MVLRVAATQKNFGIDYESPPADGIRPVTNSLVKFDISFQKIIFDSDWGAIDILICRHYLTKI